MSRSLNASPFSLLYGRKPVLPNDLKYGVNFQEGKDSDCFRLEQRKTLKESYAKLLETKSQNQQKYKEYYDRHHKPVDVKVGDMVMMHRPTTVRGLSSELLPKWEGPYNVIEEINPVTFKIANESNVFVRHVQSLRRYVPFCGSRCLV